MRRIIVLTFIFIGIIAFGFEAHPQLIKKAGELIQSAFDSHADSIGMTASNNIRTDRQAMADSIRILEMTLKMQEMKLNEMQLRSQLANALNRNNTTDSLKIARQQQRIDSLRSVTKGVPVMVEGDTLFMIYASRGGHSARDRAETTNDMLMKIGKTGSDSRDSVYMLDNENYIDIMYGERVLITITDQDALWQGVTMQELADQYMPVLIDKISYLKEENSFWQIIKRAVLFVCVLTMQYLMFRLINYLFRKLRRQIIRFKQRRLKPIIIRDYELLNTRRLCRILIGLSNLLRYVILLLLLILTVPMLFSIFPQTEKLAYRILYYIVDPVRMVLIAIAEYIPNLFIILVIWYCVKYIIRGLRYITSEIKNEKLKISGFYPDWAQPTFNIIRFLLYAFMIAMIYPYLPGAESGVFQGISVFVGLIVSLGSSTVISNFIAGFVITYMRPFKIGDFIKVNDTIGNVIEKTPFITRLRTIKNELITIPNSFIMSANTVNYSASARRYGLIIHTILTMGYETPWRKVHNLLIKAALDTPGVEQNPQPFVLETELNDNYMCYQINAYVKNADDVPQIKSDLLQNIQDLFHTAGIELVAPHYFATRDGNESRIPEDFRRIHETPESPFSL
ncbi:MAG: mechanosensitive ion channel family protein [Bacteroides sp.]|nr:mechanosensitive ion channel family protein [Bacteroides sp.]